MKEKLNQNQVNQEARWASFFKIDPDNWPDLPPPVIKPKRLRNPYKLLGIARLTNELRELPESPEIPPGWNIPQAYLDVNLIAKRRRGRKSDELKRKARSLALKLVKQYKAGEVSLNEVRHFYRAKATLLIRKEDYESYLEDRRKIVKSRPKTEVERQFKKLTKKAPRLTWSQYIKLRIWELFAGDLQ